MPIPHLLKPVDRAHAHFIAISHSCCRRFDLDRRYHRSVGRSQKEFQGRVVDLCRLDALGLRRRHRHREEMGRQIDKCGITIDVTQFKDYVESINQYTAGAYDAVRITNMDALMSLLQKRLTNSVQ